jgi:peroxiredoxin
MRLVAVSTDDADGCRAMQVLVGDDMRIFRDPEAQIIGALGLREIDSPTGRVVSRPAVFVIDARGIVRYRYVSRDAEDRPKAALLLLAAESLHT